MVSMFTALKVYCCALGILASFSAFVWIAFHAYAMSMTQKGQTDLIVGRYLDISFGLLGLSSSAALLYGAFVESKTWISVWTLGSATVVIGFWGWYFYRCYGVDHPESYVEAKSIGLALSVWYVILIIPVLVYSRYLQSHLQQQREQEDTFIGDRDPQGNHNRNRRPRRRSYWRGCLGSALLCTSSRSDVVSGHSDRWRLCDILFSTESMMDGGSSCGGGQGVTTNIYINSPMSTQGGSALEHTGKSWGHKKSNYCQIVTADGCRITIPKEEDLYNPV